MDNAPKKRRPKGPPAIGDLDVSKAIATSIIEQERLLRLEKSALLKSQREASTRQPLEMSNGDETHG